MKKRLFLILALLLSFSSLIGCTSKISSLNERFAGKEVYICKNDYDIIPGKKVIKEIVPFNVNANSYNVHLSNNSGSDDVVGWVSNSSNYLEEMEKDLMDYPYCSQEGFRQYKAQEIKEAQLRIEKKAADEAKRKEQLADCEQAINEAQQHRNNLNSLGELFILDETITSNPENRTSNWGFCLKVIGHANDGILVKSNCTFSPFANLLLKAFIECEDKYYFIYTSDNYADGECYKDWKYLHRDVGVYNWDGRRIRAFKKTSFKVSEIEYQTYLKNKTLKCCITENNNIKICN